MDTGGDSHLWGVLSNAEWELLKWFFRQIVWASVIPALGGVIQKVRSGSLDWWVLGTIFVSSAVILYVTSEGPHFSVASGLLFWFVGGGVVLIVAVIVTWAYFHTPSIRKVRPLLSSPQDAANREKITVLFRAYGNPASADLQQVIRGLLDQFRHFHIGEDVSEGHEIMAILAHNGPYIACATATDSLSKAIRQGEIGAGLHSLFAEFGKFFTAYQNLVRWVKRLDDFQLRFVTECVANGGRVTRFKSVIESKEFVSWQEKHKLFHRQLRELLAVEDFAQLQKLTDGQWSDTFN